MDSRTGVDGDRCQGSGVSSTYARSAPSLGDPDVLDDLALACRGTAGALRDDASRLRGADVADWSGRAADGFAQSVHGLPRDLVRAADSYDTVARALSTYATDLRAVLRLARRADTELEELAGMLLVERHGLVGGLDPESVAVRARRIAAYEQEQQAVRRRLAGLVDDAALSAGSAACRVRSACDAPQAPPSLFERLADGAGDWVQAHAEVLTQVSLVLKGIAAVAGVLSLVPGLGVVSAPIAIAAGVAAVCIDAALASRRRASWSGVAVDAALTAVPAARPAGVAVREVRTRLGSVVVYRVEGTTNTRIAMDADNNVTFQRQSMLYLNVGNRSRAEDYYRRKLADGLPGVQLKAFRVPKGRYRDLSIRAVDQDVAKAFRDRPLRVDITVARDQYGLRKADFRELERHILPGSGRVLR